MQSPDPKYATTMLVIELQSRRAAGQCTAALERQILTHMAKLVRGVARKLKHCGSLTLDDLTQDGLLQVVKCLVLYDVTRGGQTFEQVACQRARFAMLDAVRMRSADVHLPDGVGRGRTRMAGVATLPFIVSRDAPGPDGSPEHDVLGEADADHATPETLFSTREAAARVIELIPELPPLRRKVVCATFGIGAPVRTLRELAIELKMSRFAVQKVLDAGVQHLRALLRC